MTSWARVLGAAVLLVGLTGCADNVRTHWLAGGTALTTGPDVRAIVESEVGAGSVSGRVQPRHIRCAEPSPDVAKAVSNGFGADLSALVSGLPGNVTPQVAAAVSRSHAEAIAQLTERLATMQLLRDGLYRACEAYANGAISDTTYAVMLSRYDKTMVTMLMGELAAGAFGRTLAGGGTGAESTSAASQELADNQRRARELEGALKVTQEQHAEDERALKAAEDEAKADPADAGKARRVDDLKRSSDQSSKDVARNERELKTALKAESTSAAKALQVITAGGITAPNNPEISRALTELARKYIENINFDALEVACVSSLDRPATAGTTQFAAFCTSGGLLTGLQAQKHELLKALIARATEEKKRAAEIASLDAAAKDLQAYIKMLDSLGAQLEVLRRSGTVVKTTSTP